MKKYILLFILLISLTTLGQTTHEVRFVIKREKSPEDKSNPYTVTIELKEENAYFQTTTKFPDIYIISFIPQAIKTKSKKLIFKYSENKEDPDTDIIALKQPIINLNTYLTNEILTQILNRDIEGDQIDITIDIFAAQNDFTRPYKDLYLKIKEFCKQIGVEITEPIIKSKGLWDLPRSLWQKYIGKRFQYWHW